MSALTRCGWTQCSRTSKAAARGKSAGASWFARRRYEAPCCRSSLAAVAQLERLGWKRPVQEPALRQSWDTASPRIGWTPGERSCGSSPHLPTLARLEVITSLLCWSLLNTALHLGASTDCTPVRSHQSHHVIITALPHDVIQARPYHKGYKSLLLESTVVRHLHRSVCAYAPAVSQDAPANSILNKP